MLHNDARVTFERYIASFCAPFSGHSERRRYCSHDDDSLLIDVKLTPKHVTGLKLLWKERLLDPEVQRKRMEGYAHHRVCIAPLL